MPASTAALRAANARRVLDALRRGPASQAELARRTGLAPATVSAIVRTLTATGSVEVSIGTSNGRRAHEVRLGSGPVAAGIDLDHRHIRVVVGSGSVLAERFVEVDADLSAVEGIDTAVRLLEEALRESGRDRLAAVALGLPAPVDVRTGEVGSSSILPNWVGVRAEDVLRDRLGLPVVVDNDSNLGALGEMTWGASAGKRDSAYIKASTGIGAGLVIAGELFRGLAGTAGEIGHTTIDENGPVCRCGNRGCLEMLAGVPILLRLLEQAYGRALTLPEAIARAQAGDPGCVRVLADAGRHIGVAAANLANLLNPEVIVVGGELAQAGDLLLDPLRTVVRRYAIPSAASLAEVVTTQLGNRAEALGALALALQHAERLPFEH
ncbi:ROK family transcriptional regulator [Fodinicola acaciae]|uniref:ROK family transcriptional regulator n=1 Tax=Fodinicola acaciae TaxID=2681555 RepID=UPI0013D0F3D4|nr:ROK family transcriptional regulator [Fodinicola acaciae]